MRTEGAEERKSREAIRALGEMRQGGERERYMVKVVYLFYIQS